MSTPSKSPSGGAGYLAAPTALAAPSPLPASPTNTIAQSPHGSPQHHTPAGHAPLSKSSSGSNKPTARKVGKYVLGKTLGQGSFGKVKFATDTETGRHVAIKMMDKAKIRANNMGEQIKKEISIMKMIKTDHVVQLLEVLASATTIYVVLELVTGGELFDKIVSEGNFEEAEARHYYQQLIDGIAHCHANNVCHRDLKPENLLLDVHGNLKISDFGLSALSSDMATGDLLHTTCGTPNYVAPEVLLSSGDKGYDGRAADIWSSGIILYVLLAGFLPFDESSMVELFRKIVKADFAYPSTLSPEAVHLLSIILNPDPLKRATIQEIKASAWYRGMTADELAREEDEKEQRRLEQEQLLAGGGISVSGIESDASPDQTRLEIDRVPSGDTSEAITYIDEKKNVGASPGLKAFTLDGRQQQQQQHSTHPHHPHHHPHHHHAQHHLQPGSAGSTPTGLSPAFGPQSGTGSQQASPVNSSLQSRRRLAGALDPENDPLALDDEEADIKGPIPLNAFDLINMVGGAAMGRMFQRGQEKKIRTFTQFTTSLPLDEILQRLDLLLHAMSATTHKLYVRQCIVKASRSTPRGTLLGSCQLYQMTPKLFMVEWTKLKGDAFLFHDFFKEVKKRFSGTKEELVGPSPPQSPNAAMMAHNNQAYASEEDEEEQHTQTNKK